MLTKLKGRRERLFWSLVNSVASLLQARRCAAESRSLRTSRPVPLFGLELASLGHARETRYQNVRWLDARKGQPKSTLHHISQFMNKSGHEVVITLEIWVPGERVKEISPSVNVSSGGLRRSHYQD